MTRARGFALHRAVLIAAFFVAGGATLRANEQSTATSPAASAPVSCRDNADALGVSRVVEIDTTGGPRFGMPGPEPYPLLQDREVVLTFDDGPIARYTRPILDALDAYCTKATFFAVGRMALSDPMTLRETADRGHTIATHTWSHRRLDQIGTTASTREIELGYSAISLALGKPAAPLFRFPYLGESSAMRAHLKSRDIANVAIDIDSRDFLTRNPSVMRKNVMSQLAKKGRGIILFHDIQPSTAGGLRTLLGELKAKGFKVVHLAAKTPGTTLPEFDLLAEKEAQRRKLVLSNQPLADRSAVWPIAAGEPERLPWEADAEPVGPGARKPAAPLPPPVRPNLKPTINDDSWATNPLGRP